MRAAALITLMLLLAPFKSVAQANPDSAKHRNECRNAVRVVTSGQPRASQEWAFSKIGSCGVEAGRALAAILPRMRHSADTARLGRYFSATREVYDGQVFAAAMEIAADRQATAQARVYAIRSLIWSGNPGRLLSYSDLAGDARGRTRCAGGFTTHVSLSAGTPLPSDYDVRVRTLAARLARDRSEPMEVQRAAQCATLTTKSVWLEEWLHP